VCLMVIALGRHPDLPFVLAGNRDEFHARPTLAAHHWADRPGIVGGRDVEKGGTWLGVSARGAFATVTNYRDPARRVPDARSRGLLVSDFLDDPAHATARQYVAHRVAEGDRHDGFNLVAADASGVWYGSNRGAMRRLGPGLHALSNHLIDTPWPKAERLRANAGRALDDRGSSLVDSLFEALADRTPVADRDLPSTGVPVEWERRLSTAFIVSPDYGTRSSSVLTMHRDGILRFEERSFDARGAEIGRVVIEVPLADPIDVQAG
jgi:uncharacterized protein with NRDE domain